MTPLWITTVLLGVFLFLVVAFGIFRTLAFSRYFVYRVHSHEVVVAVSLRGFYLYVDGTLSDRLEGHIRVATLHTVVDGIEFRSVVTIRFRGPSFDTAYNNTPLIPESGGRKYK